MFREPFEEPEMDKSTKESTFTLPKDLDALLAHLYLLERQYGIVITAVTRGDVEDAWQNSHFSDGKESPVFTNEMWDKFQDTWAWRKGLSQVMWDGVWDCLNNGIDDMKEKLSDEVAK